MCLLFIYLTIWVFCLHVFLSNTCKPGAYGGQKSVSDLIGLELQMGLSWKWKSGSLKELLMLITNPALQHHVSTCLQVHVSLVLLSCAQASILWSNWSFKDLMNTTNVQGSQLLNVTMF